jgi:hypothetical protein
MTDTRRPDDGADPQTPQSESIPGPTYEHPDGVNDPVDEQYGGADRQDDGVHNSDH